ncbi:MAG TPA: tRNA pseudouridine(55) synthase TruB [Anaerolineae bacterium]|nr:tRNA pseudouridine(55) synthase TruB [Anaerolineae bacterium]
MRDGLLIIDKPAGLTSHDVVNRVRRTTKTRQVGHAGTLDPMATGVLVVCLGQATRLSEYLLGHDKIYHATIRLGVETNTYDAAGEIVSTRAVNVDRAAVEQALAQLQGEVQQVPPMYSALKRAGQKLYELARQGIEIEREARSVIIHSIELCSYQAPDVTVDVRCSAGTYIRSIAHDLGTALGTGGHLTALKRTAAGPFTLDQALPLDAFEAAAQTGRWDEHLQTMDAALNDWPLVVLGEPDRIRALNGAPIFSLTLAGSRCRAHDERGDLIALLVFDQKKKWWRAEKVLYASSS